MTKTPLISLIIPAYNCGQSIITCLDSLTCQDMSEVEIIVIDDHSVNETETVIKEYSKRFSNIHYVRLPYNQGPGSARNLGIDISRGSYIGFIDSDDIVFPNYIEVLKLNILQYSSELFVFGYSRKYIRKQNVFELLYPFSKKTIKPVIKSNHVDFLFINIEVSSVIKLIRKDILIQNPNIRFSSQKVAEDLYFSLLLYPHINDYTLITSSLYQYHLKESSLSRSFNCTDDYLQILHSVIDQYKKHNFFVKYYVYVSYVLTKHLFLANLLRFKRQKHMNNYNDLVLLRNELSKVFPDYSENLFLKHEPFYVRVTIWLLKNCPYIFKVIINGDKN